MKRERLASTLQVFVVGGAFLLTGCANFFVKPNTGGTSGGSTGAGSVTSDYVYLINSNATVSEFVVGTGKLIAITGSPFAVETPLSTAASIIVTPANSFAYVGGTGGILGYSIGTNGALTLTMSRGVTEQANYSSLAVAPNGQYLLALDNLNNVIWVFSINLSTGALTPVNATYPLNVSAVTAPGRMIKISPNSNVVAVAEGTGGDYIFAFNQSTGVLTPTFSVNAPPSGYTDLSVAFDPPSAHLFIGRGITAAGNSQVLSYSLATTGVIGTLVGSYATGAAPYAVLIDATNTYAYTANRGDSTVSGYTVASGALTAISGSPYASGGGTTALVQDITRKYILAAAAASTSGADLTLYAFDLTVPGKLNSVATSQNGSGVTGSIAMAATHPQ